MANWIKTEKREEIHTIELTRDEVILLRDILGNTPSSGDGDPTYMLYRFLGKILGSEKLNRL